ncbi:hypothetical protein KKG63_02565, partial [Patescibacteria group bacterium]|nr:hypothetical protein [Patescibacteria group bacterium]
MRIKCLTTKPKGTAISIYLPTSKTWRENEKSKIMLKNIISELADNPAVDKELIKPLNALLRKEQFWQTTEKGLAIFVSQNIFDYLALNRTFKKRLTV